MLATNIRRILSLLLACSVVLSTVPFPVLANEALVSVTPELIQIEENTPADPIDENTTILNKKAEITLPEQLDSRIAILLEQYGITAEMNDEEIASAIIAVDGETLQITMEEIHAINEAGHAFTSEDHQYMDEQRAYTYFRFCTVLDQIMTPALLANYEIDGIKLSNSGGSLTYNTDTKTATATIAGSGLIGFEWTQSQTLTLTNTTSNDISLTFSFAAENYTSLKINGESISDKGGSKSIDLAANTGSFKIVLESPKGKKTATLTLSGFKLTIKKPASAVTILFDNTMCSVTAGNSNVETSGTVKENISEADGIVLNTVAVGNSTFLGWVNAETHTVISKTPNFTYYPIEDTSVRPIYTNGNACFRIGSSYLFDDLNDATATAIPGSAIVAVNDGILPARDYTIPKDVTLLIPFDDADTLCKTSPILDVSHDLDIGYADTYTAKEYVQPTAYRTLTMANGANITVNGAISLSSKQCAAQTFNGHPTGPTSFLNMNEGSSITINNGGSLYAWGYITGSGTITVESGGLVYEDFQLTNWRGGTASSSMIGDYEKETYDTFPINQYYIQNVEVPMTLKAGAKEYGYISVVASAILGSAAIEFIGPSGLFRIGEGGTVTKKYQGSTDRLIIDTTGSLSLSALVVGLSGYKMNSSEYVLPVNSNFTVNIKNGTATVGEDMAFLPGVELNIQEDASLSIAAGKKLYVYDGDNWGNYAYEGRKFAPVVYAPSRPTPNPRTDAALVDAKITIAGTLDASKGSIYTPNGTANFVGVNGGKFLHPGGSSTTTYQAAQTGTDIEFVGIDAPPAELLIGENKTSKSLGTYVFNGTYWRHQDHNGGTVSCKNQAICSICGEFYGNLLPHTEVIDKAVAPAVGVSGKTEGSHCSACGEVIVAQQDLPALVGDVIYGTNIRAGDNLDLYFYINRSVVDNYSGLTAKVVSTKLDKTTNQPEFKEFPQKDWTEYSDEYYRICYENIAAKEMTEIITITVYDKDGNQFSVPVNESIRNYASRAFKTDNAELKTMMADMLNYGAAAQINFGHNTNDLANAQNTGENAVAGSALDETSISNDCKWLTEKPANCILDASVTLESSLVFNFYFKGLSSGNKAVATYTNHYGKVTHKFEGTADLNGNLSLNVEGMAAADGSQIITCELFNGDTSIGKVQGSVEGYVYNVLNATAAENATDQEKTELTNLQALCRELMKFINSAYAYFH